MTPEDITPQDIQSLITVLGDHSTKKAVRLLGFVAGQILTSPTLPKEVQLALALEYDCAIAASVSMGKSAAAVNENETKH